MTIVAAEAATSNADTERKRLAGLRAALALRGGYVVHELAAGDGFFVVWRGQSGSMRDLDELQAFSQRVGAVV